MAAKKVLKITLSDGMKQAAFSLGLTPGQSLAPSRDLLVSTFNKAPSRLHLLIFCLRLCCTQSRRRTSATPEQWLDQAAGSPPETGSAGSTGSLVCRLRLWEYEGLGLHVVLRTAVFLASNTTSPLDFCKTLICGLARRQKIQNASVIVTKISERGRIVD